MCSLSVSHKSLDNYYIDLYRDCTHQLLGLLNDFIRYITKQKNYIAQTNKDFYLRVYKKIAVFKSKMDIKKYNKKYLEYSPFCQVSIQVEKGVPYCIFEINQRFPDIVLRYKIYEIDGELFSFPVDSLSYNNFLLYNKYIQKFRSKILNPKIKNNQK